MWVFTDVTERVQAERQRREAEERLRTVLDNMPVVLWAMDRDGVVTLTEGRGLERASVKSGQGVGRSVNILHEKRPAVIAAARRALAGESFTEVLEVRGIQYECMISPMRDEDGEISGVLGVAADVTERIRAERERRDAEERLNSVLEHMPIVLWAVDKDGVLTVREGKGLEALNLRAGEGIGRSMDVLLKDLPIFHKAVKRALSGEVFTETNKIQEVSFETTFSPIRSESGEITGALGVSANVTERDYAQAQLIQSAKLATLGEMATSLAHELNQPLNVIRMAADSTLERLADGDRDFDNVHTKLERISRQTERAAAIIDHMRIFGRKSEDRPEQIDPRDAVSGALSIMTERLRLHSIDLSVDLPDACRRVTGHMVQLEQVLLNVLANAYDALEVRDSSHGPKAIFIHVVERKAAEEVEIVVEDTGGGIKEEVATRLFEPFVTTKKIGKGTGLGLSISYGIVTEMGGTIEARNTESGTQIKITLPVAHLELVNA